MMTDKDYKGCPECGKKSGHITTRIGSRMCCHGCGFRSSLTFWQENGKVEPDYIPEPGDVVCMLERDGTSRYRVFSHYGGDGMIYFLIDHKGIETRTDGGVAPWHNVTLEPAEPTEVISLERPRYKSFEIDWNECNVPIIQIAISEKAEERVEAKNGQKIGDYRIIRFGDNEEYASNPYDDNVPSHQAGNYKYAYGRLEK